MKFCFRVDASLQIGSGHIVRCLTVADALARQGHESYFICREHEGHLIAYIHQKGYKVYSLKLINSQENCFGLTEYEKWLGVSEEKDAIETLEVLSQEKADWVVVDHYGLSVIWQNSIRQNVKKVLVIDDLANRKHAADIILDCGLTHDKSDYQPLNSICNAHYLLGPQYALLRPEFHAKRALIEKKPRTFSLDVLRILINLGGVDKDNVTGQVLSELTHYLNPQYLDITVVMGASAPHKTAVQEQVKELKFANQVVLVNVNNMADLMLEHDLAIGAAGSTAWERCCLGLPTIMLCMAENQKMIAADLNKVGAAIAIEQSEIGHKLLPILLTLNTDKLQKMQKNAFQVTEGCGVELLVAAILSSESNI